MNFLKRLNEKLVNGEDPARRATPQCASALEELLTWEGDPEERKFIWELLERMYDALMGRSIEDLPVRMKLVDWADGSPTLFLPRSPVTALLESYMNPVHKMERLAWVLRHVENVAKLLDPTQWDPKEARGTTLSFCPLLFSALRQGVRQNDMRCFEMLLDRLEYDCDAEERKRIMNLHSGVVDKSYPTNEHDEYGGSTLLHLVAAIASEETYGDDMAGHIVSYIIPRLLENGASPDERNDRGLTPYWSACEKNVRESMGRPDVFRPDAPWQEFELRDTQGRLLCARFLDTFEEKRKENPFCDGVDLREIEALDDGLQAVLDAYLRYEPSLPRELVDEYRQLFSDSVARVGIRCDYASYVVAMSIRVGADPRYVLPGRAEPWEEAILAAPAPGGKEETIDALFHTPGPDGISLAETLSDEEIDWIRNHGGRDAEKLVDGILSEREERDGGILER